MLRQDKSIILSKIKLITVGLVNYFKLADTKIKLQSLGEWISRRLRACIWKTWKKVKTKSNNLQKLGIPNSSILNKTITN